jgi:osmotically-inducible protein OsmY
MIINSINVQIRNIVMVFTIFLLSTQLAFPNNAAKDLAEKVRSKINSYYIVDNFQITSTNNGRVEIKGEVKTLYDRLNIFDIIAKVPGVKEITDDLIVQSTILPDKVIEANIISEMNLVKSILEPDRIHVHVDKGDVILTGEVSFYREKLLAETVVSWQEGVKSISNEINVLSSNKAVSDDNLKVVLGEILKNHFPLSNELTFEVKNGIVTLSGKAYTLWDKKRIAKEFSGVMGVKQVINNLKVKELAS